MEYTHRKVNCCWLEAFIAIIDGSDWYASVCWFSHEMGDTSASCCSLWYIYFQIGQLQREKGFIWQLDLCIGDSFDCSIYHSCYNWVKHYVFPVFGNFCFLNSTKWWACTSLWFIQIKSLCLEHNSDIIFLQYYYMCCQIHNARLTITCSFYLVHKMGIFELCSNPCHLVSEPLRRFPSCSGNCQIL